MAVASKLTDGAKVMLKPNRANAYGIDPRAVYTVARTYTLNGYKSLWVNLCEIEGSFPQSDFR